MDSYVIRIYRRDEKSPGKAAGQVEFIEKDRMESFTCVDELVEILGLKEKGAPGHVSKVRTKAPGHKSKKHLAGRES